MSIVAFVSYTFSRKKNKVTKILKSFSHLIKKHFGINVKGFSTKNSKAF